LFEYLHAYKSVSVFKKRNIPCVLDMHNVLLQSYKSQYDRPLPQFIKKYHIKKYQMTEVNSWKSFDAIIAINNNELNYVKQNVAQGIKLFYIAMGIDMSKWPYVWQPAKPQRFAYYGGMAAIYNKQNALFCVKSIMPLVWKKYPETEFWIIGSDPDNELMLLEQDPRIRVIGYQENVQNSLKHISVFLCPWKGKYGFRSRIVEVMATGIPVICSRDAIDGMELQEGRGLFFAENEHEFADQAINLVNNLRLLEDQSKQARIQVEELYSFENTYQSGFEKIRNWIINR
jgi:glycosyltransferase involved in cell wall biosynthesis